MGICKGIEFTGGCCKTASDTDAITVRDTAEACEVTEAAVRGVVVEAEGSPVAVALEAGAFLARGFLGGTVMVPVIVEEAAGTGVTE